MGLKMAEIIKKWLSMSLKKLWLVYKNIETSPSQIGPSKIHKAGVSFLYTFSLGVAITLIYQVLTYQAVFTGLVPHGTWDGEVEIPSVLICPEKETYEYAFFHWNEEIELLNLTTEAVNFLAQMAYEGHLSDDSAKQKFEKFHSQDKNLTTLWQSIASEQYFLHVSNRRRKYSEGKCEIIGGGWRDQFGEVLRDKRCFLHIKGVGRDYVDRPFSYGVPNVEGLWLRDKRFCFFINMTGKHMTLFDHFHTDTDPEFEFYHEYYQNTPKNRALAKQFPVKKLYFWFGNVKTQEIKLTETYNEGGPTAVVKLSLYKKQSHMPEVCQPLLKEKCAKEREVVNNSWTSLTTITMSKGLRSAISLIIDVANWHEIEEYKKFSSIEMTEIIGNILGICTGLSLFGISKFLVILIFRLKDKMTKHKLIAWIEMGLFSFFGLWSISFLIYKAWDMYQSSNTRFYLQYDIKKLAEGTPFPNIEFCPYLLESFNKTTIKHYNISYHLLMYIGSLAVLQPPVTFLQEAKVTKPYFLYDQQAPTELGYYWTFMRFPLWKVNEELHENYMKAAETEYENLCQKLGIDSKQPAWTVYIQLLLDPCSLIDKCLVNGLAVECCKGFRHKISWNFQDFPACMTFVEGKKYNQTIYDHNHGLQIFWNYTSYITHRLDHPWYDDYVRNYIKQCKLEYNCSTAWPHGWNRGNGMDIHLDPSHIGIWTCTGNWCNMGEQNFSPGTSAMIPIRHRRTILLERNEKNNCANKNPPLNEMWYLKTKVIHRRCGCNMCMDQQWVEPCCQPNSLGRCLTKVGMYQSLCRKNKKNPLQTDYPANLSSNIPVHGLLGDIQQCSVDEVFANPKSTFYEDFIAIKGNMTQAMKKACIRYEPIGGKGQVQYSSTDEAIDRHLIVYNFYYNSPLIEEYHEFDRLNTWEIFCLVCGAISLILGVTVIGSLGKIYDVTLMQKEFFKSKYFNFGTLHKFETRFMHIIELGNVVHPMEIRELQHSKKEQKIPGQPSTISITKDLTVITPKRASNSNKTTCPNILSISEDRIEQKTSETSGTISSSPNTSAGHGMIVIFALGGTLFCLFQMYQIITENPINVLYTVTDENIEIPSLALCKLENNAYPELSNYVKSPLVECEVNNKMESCSDLLVVYLQTESYSCVVSIIPRGQSLQLSLSAPVPMTHFWIGGMKQVQKLHLPKDINRPLMEGFIHYIFYEQYEIVDKTFCSSETHLCPYCPEHHSLGSSDYCCLKKDLQLHNLSSPASVQHCHESTYQFSSNQGKGACYTK